MAIGQNPNPFVDSVSGDRIEIPDDLGGGWVEIKSEMSIEDWQRIEGDQIRITIARSEPHNRSQRRALVRSSNDSDDGTREGKFEPGYITALERNIIRWSYNVPLSRDNIARLRRPIADLIMEEIDNRNIPLLTKRGESMIPTTMPYEAGNPRP